MSHNGDLFTQAKHIIPGGVNSPVRAFNAVGGSPKFIKKAYGAYLLDEDDQQFIDYIGSWGPMIVGHSHPKVIQAVISACENGLSFGAPTKCEVRLAEKIQKIMPNIEMLRMVNSGTEATMTAIRLARGYTKRNKIIKFAGCYHGHSDSLLINAGSGALTFGTPSSPGIPAGIVEHTLSAQFNDIDSVSELFEKFPNDIAAIILEPVAGNMGMVPPNDGFLQALRELCDQYHSLLIFDEVMTGFRVALGGAQDIYKIKPDITTLGKIIGGGMPVGAIGGSKEIMQCLSPIGPVYQAGTLSGNPIAMTAGLATLNLIEEEGFYHALQQTTLSLTQGLKARAEAANIPLAVEALGGMFGFFFSDEPRVRNFEQVQACDTKRFKVFFNLMLENGIYLAPSAFEAGFVSSAHSKADIQQTLDAAEQAFSQL